MDKLEKYARHLAKQYPTYVNQQYHGKNGADSDNEKGYWRGMADSVLAMLNDLKHAGLIAHTGLYNDEWPAVVPKTNLIVDYLKAVKKVDND